MKMVTYVGALVCVCCVVINTSHSHERKNRRRRSSKNRLDHETNFETELAKNIINEEEKREQEHVDLALGSDHFFNDIDHMILENTNPAVTKYSDSYDTSDSGDTSNSDFKEKKDESAKSKKDALASGEEALQSIGFEADTSDGEDDSKTAKPTKKITETRKEKKPEARHPTKKHVVHAKNNTAKKSPFVELYGKEEIKEAMEKAGVGKKAGAGEKRQMAGNDAITMAQGSMQRGIQPDQPFHMDDVQKIDQLQHSIGFPHTLVERTHPGVPDDDDDDEDSDDLGGYHGYHHNDDLDLYDGHEDENDDYDDDDDDEGGYDEGAKLIKDKHPTTAYTRSMSANVKKVSVMGSDDVTDDVTDDDDGDRQEEDQEADRKSIDIPGDMQEMAEEKGLETLHDDDHLSMDAHAYHVYHPPNHLMGKVYNKYSRHEVHQSISQTNPCENGGIYAPLSGGQHVCICHEKFIGKNCEDLNYCYHRPCKHCGKCQLTKQWPHYKCECCKKYSGKHCEARNPCEPNPCLNEGECTHDGRTPSCVCKPKFKGKLCGEVNNCNPSPCLNGGTCFEKQGEGNFWCECPESWLGTVCQLASQCASEPCHNGGSCREYGGGKFQCMCVEGFTGKTCTEKICSPSPCFNGGTCVDDNRDFHCICPPWAQGKVCTEISPCLMNPCHNAARCIDRHSGFRWALGPMEYYCLCQPPYYGPHCEVNKCKLCDAHAHCEIDHCECDEGYEGDGTVCTKLPSPCHPNPCHNNGVCIDEGHGFFHCRCKTHYKAPYCIEVNPCNPSPCNGGTCVPQGIGGFKCVSCPEGFTGKRCQIIDPCETNPCQHHGTCIQKSDTDASFGCKCINHWQGKVCEVCGCPKSKDPKLPHSFCNDNGLCTCPENHDWDDKFGTCDQRSYGASICDSQPCQCGGTCIPDLESPLSKYSCQCPAQCSGQLCEIVKHCSNHQPCKNGGTCIDVNDYRKYTCKCPPGFSGQNCTAHFTTTPTPLHSPCQPSPCEHNGICIPVGENYDCKCVAQYMGAHCEIDKCKDCDEHARCLAGECVCRKGYVGNGYLCVKDCKRKCKDLQICVEGTCQCMSGYNLVHNVCVHVPVEVEEEEEEESDQNDDQKDFSTTPTSHTSDTKLNPTKKPHRTVEFVTHFTKKPTKKPVTTKKPAVTTTSEYAKPGNVTLSPVITKNSVTTNAPITATPIMPVISLISKSVANILGSVKTTTSPILPAGKTTTTKSPESPAGVDNTMDSIGPPGENSKSKSDEKQTGPPGSRNIILNDDEEVTEIIEPGGNIQRIDDGNDDGTASAAEEKLRSDVNDKKDTQIHKNTKQRVTSGVFRLAVNFEKDAKKIEEKRNNLSVVNKDADEKIHKPVQITPSVSVKKKTNNNTQDKPEHNIQPPYSTTERILKHIQKLEKSFSQDIASEKTTSVEHDTNLQTSMPSSYTNASHVSRDVDIPSEEVTSPLRTAIKSFLNQSESEAPSTLTDSKLPESWYEASKKLSSKNSEPSEMSKTTKKPKAKPVEINRKTLEKPSISVLASGKSTKTTEDVFSVPDDGQRDLSSEMHDKRSTFRQATKDDLSSTSESKEDFVELLKQYGKLKDEVTELAYTKKNDKIIQEHDFNARKKP